MRSRYTPEAFTDREKIFEYCMSDHQAEREMCWAASVRQYGYSVITPTVDTRRAILMCE
jgi:hypothetical protein